MTDFIFIFLPLSLGIVAFFTGRNLGWSKGYREGKAINAPLVSALEDEVTAERELTMALRGKADAQERLMKQLYTQIGLLKEAQNAMERTIAAQDSTIAIYKRIH